MFKQNSLGEYWQSYCLICLADVYAYRIDDIHFIFEDEGLIGSPICKSCYGDLKEKIPERIDLIKKNEIEKVKCLAEQIFNNIEKTHQPIKKKIKKNNNSIDKWI